MTPVTSKASNPSLGKILLHDGPLVASLPGKTNRRRKYRVEFNTETPTCSCPDFNYRDKALNDETCKHIDLMEDVLEMARLGDEVSREVLVALTHTCVIREPTPIQ